ncbi:MAG: GAF domain-containing protein [Alphaproteobacteria bacterium]|nr:GAF domain-containing protein [Alphaproteobacteria bacterium]
MTWLLEAALAQAQRLTGDVTLCRVSMAVYDSGTSMVAAFAQVGEPHDILDRYQWDLRDTPLLAAAARDGQARTIGDLRDYSDPDADYLGALRGAGYLSALTVPMVCGHQISGFVFFHARAAFFFTPDVVTRLTAFIADMPRFLMRELERDL